MKKIVAIVALLLTTFIGFSKSKVSDVHNMNFRKSSLYTYDTTVKDYIKMSDSKVESTFLFDLKHKKIVVVINSKIFDFKVTKYKYYKKEKTIFINANFEGSHIKIIVRPISIDIVEGNNYIYFYDKLLQ